MSSSLSVSNEDELGILVEEGDRPVILVEQSERGVVLYSREEMADKGDSVPAWHPEDFVTYGRDDHRKELRDTLQSLTLTSTRSSHMLERGNVSNAVIEMLNGGDGEDDEEDEDKNPV